MKKYMAIMLWIFTYLLTFATIVPSAAAATTITISDTSPNVPAASQSYLRQASFSVDVTTKWEEDFTFVPKKNKLALTIEEGPASLSAYSWWDMGDVTSTFTTPIGRKESVEISRFTWYPYVIATYIVIYGEVEIEVADSGGFKITPSKITAVREGEYSFTVEGGGILTDTTISFNVRYTYYWNELQTVDGITLYTGPKASDRNIKGTPRVDVSTGTMGTGTFAIILAIIGITAVLVFVLLRKRKIAKAPPPPPLPPAAPPPVAEVRPPAPPPRIPPPKSCPQCGAVLPPEAKFCPKCGSKIS